MERFFGGSPASTIVKLVLLSVVVGIVFSALGIDITELPRRIMLLARRLYDLGFGVFESVFQYFLLGAVVVVPIWFISRLLRSRKNRDS